MALINDPRKLFAYKLGTVLSGEKKVLTMLKKSEKRAQQEELKQQFGITARRPRARSRTSSRPSKRSVRSPPAARTP